MRKLITGIALAGAMTLIPSAAHANGCFDIHDYVHANSPEACHGQLVAFFASNGITTPGQTAKWLAEHGMTNEDGTKITAGDVNKWVKDICEQFHDGPPS